MYDVLLHFIPIYLFVCFFNYNTKVSYMQQITKCIKNESDGKYEQ